MTQTRKSLAGTKQNDYVPGLIHLIGILSWRFQRPIEPRVEDIDVEIFLQRIIDLWRPKFAKVNVTPVLYVEESIERMRGGFAFAGPGLHQSDLQCT